MVSHRPKTPEPDAEIVKHRSIGKRVGLAVAAVAVLATAGVLVKVNSSEGARADSGTPATSSVATSAVTSSAEPTADPAVADAAARDAFFALATRADSPTPYSTIFGSTDRGIALATTTCGTINFDPTSDGVWESANDLETGEYAFPVPEAWAFVDLSVSIYCPQHSELVAETIAEVTA